MPQVAIVVVTYQSSRVIGACLDAALLVSDAEIVVVENSGDLPTIEEATKRGVHVIANRENLGFAAAVNAGVRATTAPIVLLVNPDARIQTGIDALLAEFADPRVGGAGGMLIGAEGKPQVGFMARNLPTPAALILEVLGLNRIWPGNPINWNYRCLGMSPMNSLAVDQPAGAFFAFRRSAWEAVGGFDENFWPIWFEDVDFCARLRAKGYSVRFNPSALAIHEGGHSINPLSLELREKYWYGSLLKYAAKHFSSTAFRLVCLSVAAGAVGRALRGLPKDGIRVLAVYSSVIRLSCARFLSGAGQIKQSA